MRQATRAQTKLYPRAPFPPRFVIPRMSAQLIDGRLIASKLLDAIAQRVAERRKEGLLVPGLAVVLVGADPASVVYVRNKRSACERVGFHARDVDLPISASEAEVLALIQSLNADPAVHGILVQLPLPPQIDAQRVIAAIDPRKDVDGFHAENLGRLALRWPGLRPCTPRGVMNLLLHTNEPIRGKHAVVVGVSNHVGRPMALELLIAGATVTCCHRFSDPLDGFVRQADIVVAAAGKPGLVKGEWIKPGAVVIDVGLSRGADGKLYGDIEFDAARERAAWITPVPGGVGPMTVATLLQNTLEAAEMAG
jgi:methylenetetrahydrofolate dehydrogenase (NADP+) / methenyltetrahydrofolate cyclohydrolase